MVVTASARLDYTSTSVGTSNWVQLSPVDGAGASISSKQLPTEISAVDIFDSSGSTLEIGTGDGTSGGTKRMGIIFKGGSDSRQPLQFSKGCTVYLRAIDTTASTGEISINFYHGRK